MKDEPSVEGQKIRDQSERIRSAFMLRTLLKRAAKDPSREALIHGLEGLSQYQTELTPPIYSPTRRIVATRGYVVSVDLKRKRWWPEGGSVLNRLAE